MLAKEIMRRKIVTVASWLTLQELAQTLERHGITGAPVVDAHGSVLGVVSQTDLVRARRESSAGIPSYHRELDEPTAALGLHFEECDRTRVEQIMTPGAISFDEETPAATLAAAMLERRVHRVLITRGKRLVGIVTTMDLLRALVALSRKAPRRAPAARAPGAART
jgi:CBS domain-containing protein